MVIRLATRPKSEKSKAAGGGSSSRLRIARRGAAPNDGRDSENEQQQGAAQHVFASGVPPALRQEQHAKDGEMGQQVHRVRDENVAAGQPSHPDSTVAANTVTAAAVITRPGPTWK